MELDTRRPFTRAAARKAGIKAGELRGRRYTMLLPGVYVDAAVDPSPAVRARAALDLHPKGAVVSHFTAAEMLGLPAPRRADTHLTVLKGDHRRRQVGISLMVNKRKLSWRWVDDVPVVHGADLFVQLAEHLSLLDLVILGDAMVKREMVGVEELRSHCAEVSDRGIARARRAAALVRERVDSPMETRVRLLLVFAGFPEPEVNPEIGSYSTDLCWRELKAVIEYDGRHHRADLDQWDHDLDRNAWFEKDGWTVVHLVARDVFKRPARTVERVYEVWRRCGGRPLRLSEEWRRHFDDPNVHDGRIVSPPPEW